MSVEYVRADNLENIVLRKKKVNMVVGLRGLGQQGKKSKQMLIQTSKVTG